MALQDKYQELISFARANGVNDLSVQEQNNVLYLTGTAPGDAIKQQIWAVYEKIDPEMRSADLVLNISVAPGASTTYTVQPGDSLSKIATKYSGLKWQDIFEANKDQISNPDLIKPGQVLKIPQ
ncbi:LysM peptidoglycan-binding domain-containing protein [Solitalea sp. MAHUQ-68]|uniref:LysM peptidoglycan-binding domain-containing protein n=1 Tax=Solitalea agri TaxID=2953739 RepID=A0A9X2EZY6_9SPHI|nr:LysM peptidoglycan-binding domain-containing protein [Solitalea agri]MCO4292154.1 LysM peptidoglycan-binding domain-containing protein [Solitalea agri]